MDARVLSLVLGAVLVGAARAAGAAVSTVSGRPRFGTFVAGRVGQRRGELMHPIAQWRGRRQRAGDRVIGLPAPDAIDVQARRVGQADPDMDARVLSLVLGAVLVGGSQAAGAAVCPPSGQAALWGSRPAASVASW